MISCLEKMYPEEKSLKKSKTWGISMQNALYANAMNNIKSKANGASEKGCRLIITGDIVENSQGLSRIFDIYISIYKNLSYIYKGEELSHYTELVFGLIVQANFTNYGNFINSPQNFIKERFNIEDCTNPGIIKEDSNISENDSNIEEESDSIPYNKEEEEKEEHVAEEVAVTKSPKYDINHKTDDIDMDIYSNESIHKEVQTNEKQNIEEQTYMKEKSIEEEQPFEELEKSQINEEANNDDFFFDGAIS